jgi:tetratricopeptide (TPR) repeat protein
MAGATAWSIETATGLVDEPTEVFRSSNALYEAGDYPGAIREYRRLVDAGVVDGTLCYNLGNAYYKSDDLGNAVLFYRRSLRLQPRNADAKENLELVTSQLKDKQFVRNQNRLVTGVIWLHNNLSATEMIALGSVSYLVLCLLGIVLILRDSPTIAAVYRKISIVSPGRLIGLSFAQDLLVAMGIATVLLATTGISSYRKLVNNRTEAVILADEIPVFSSPTEDATLQFKIHQGTVVNISDQRNEWIKVELPGGMSGWVASGSMERV